MKKLCAYLPLIAALSCGGWRAWAGDVEDVLKEISEKTKKLDSFRAKYRMKAQMSQPGYSMKSTAEGLTEWLRDGNKYMMRNEAQTRSETVTNGQTHKTESKMLSINDGEFLWTYSETNGQKSAAKNKLRENTTTVDDPFKAMRAYYDFALLPEEKLDGHACYVIEAKAKPGSPMATVGGKVIGHYRKSDGVCAKSVSYDKKGNPSSTTIYTNIEVNGRIDPDRFVFKAPPGVDVQDLTAQQPQTPDQPQTETQKNKQQPRKATEKKPAKKKIKLPGLKKKFP